MLLQKCFIKLYFFYFEPLSCWAIELLNRWAIEPLSCWTITKSQCIGKHPDAGKDWKQEEKGTTEDEMAGWHHWYKEHEFGQTAGDGEGQRNLVCVSSWGREESDTTRRLNNNNKVWIFSEEAVKLLNYPPEVWYHFLLPYISLHVHKSRYYSFF